MGETFSPMEAVALELLEWPRLCRQVAGFAATDLGRKSPLPLALTQAEAEYLTQLTAEVWGLPELPWDGVADVGEALRRAEKQGVLSAGELWAIAATLAGARAIRRAIDQAPHAPLLQQLVAECRTYPDLEREIYHCLDEGGTVRDRASEKLTEIRLGLRQTRDDIYSKLQNIIQAQGAALQETVITQRSDRYVLAVKASHKDRILGVVHDTSATGLTLFVEPHSTVPLNNRLRQAVKLEEREIERILRVLSAKVGEVVPDPQALVTVLTTLDLATARARYSRWVDGVPGQWGGDRLELRQVRHPLLVWQERQEGGQPVVAVDCVTDPIIRVVAITGPNTGGKTATLKTVGIVTLMARAGLFVPAQSPVRLPWLAPVLADIGDEQSLQQNLSTFSGHVRRIAQILGELTENALVLLDEVGAGTDPSEGSALAIALLNHLATRARLTVATTHYGELKLLKYQNPLFENASVEFDEVTLSPTYRLLWGIPGRSNALAIARRLGLTESVLANAAQHLGSGSQDVNRLIAELENQRREQQQKLAEAIALHGEAERLHREISHRAEQLRSRYRELREQQEKEVSAAIHQARKEVGRVIRKLQKGNGGAETVKHAETVLSGIGDRHLPPPTPPTPTAYQPTPGDRVRVIALGKTATVISHSGSSGEFYVRLGSLKLAVRPEEVESPT